MKGHAEFDKERKYRYLLSRTWATKPRYVHFLMLNPSTADEQKPDPTVTRCLGYARSWGYTGLLITNLFAYRTTYPRELRQAQDPVGPQADRFIRQALEQSALTVVAWGTNGGYRQRDQAVLRLLVGQEVTPHALRVTREGHPCHPLRLPAALQPEPFPHARPEITCSELTRLAFCNSVRLPHVVESDGRRLRWMAIGWIEDGPPVGTEVLVREA